MRKWFVNNWETVFVTAVVLIGTIIRFYIVAQDLDFLVATFLPDDAFYYFTIARNFVNGNGISFDSFSPTNGFHPLWLFLITPLFSFEGELPIRLTLFVSATMDMFTAVIIYRFLKEFWNDYGTPELSLYPIWFATGGEGENRYGIYQFLETCD